MLPQSTTTDFSIVPPYPKGWAPLEEKDYAEPERYAQDHPFEPVFLFVVTKRPRIALSHKRDVLLERDGPNCALCRRPLDPDSIHVDHTIPRSWQGSNHLHNLQLAHARCNLLKQSTLGRPLKGALESASLRLWARQAALYQPDLNYDDLAKTIRTLFKWHAVNRSEPDTGQILVNAIEMRAGKFKVALKKPSMGGPRFSELASSPSEFMEIYFALEQELVSYVRLLF